MTETLIIDRFEGEMAVCEKKDRTMIVLPRSSLPPDSQEGDVVILNDRAVYVDRTATAARKKANEEKLRSIRHLSEN